MQIAPHGCAETHMVFIASQLRLAREFAGELHMYDNYSAKKATDMSASCIRCLHSFCLRLMAKRHMTNIKIICLHASMTHLNFIFVARLNSCKKCYIFVTTFLTLNVGYDRMKKMYFLLEVKYSGQARISFKNRRNA